MKKCIDCLAVKEASEFSKNARYKDGRDSRCRPCQKLKVARLYATPEAQAARIAKRKLYASENPEKRRASAAKWRAANREKLKIYSARAEAKRREQKMRQYRENKEYYKELARKWSERNRDLIAYHASARRARLAQRTPTWLTDSDRQKILKMYQDAAALTAWEGEPWHVDHILPLKGKYVSGLHVPENLQLMRGAENMGKNNRWLPE